MGKRETAPKLCGMEQQYVIDLEANSYCNLSDTPTQNNIRVVKMATRTRLANQMQMARIQPGMVQYLVYKQGEP